MTIHEPPQTASSQRRTRPRRRQPEAERKRIMCPRPGAHGHRFYTKARAGEIVTCPRCLPDGWRVLVIVGHRASQKPADVGRVVSVERIAP